MWRAARSSYDARNMIYPVYTNQSLGDLFLAPDRWSGTGSGVRLGHPVAFVSTPCRRQRRALRGGTGLGSASAARGSAGCGRARALQARAPARLGGSSPARRTLLRLAAKVLTLIRPPEPLDCAATRARGTVERTPRRCCVAARDCRADSVRRRLPCRCWYVGRRCSSRGKRT